MIMHPHVNSLSCRPAFATIPGALLLFVYALLFFFSPPAHAQQSGDNLLENDTVSQKYIFELSGTVLNEKFTGVTMSLQLSGPSPGSTDPYLILAGGFPDEQARNSFFWNSEKSTMEANANQITCKIKEGDLPAFPIYFYYLSPELLKQKFTHMEKEDRQKVLKIAVPTKVFAQAGELRVTVNSLTISGSVWLQGYDTIQKSYVRYSAEFMGRRAAHVEQKIQRKYR